MRTSSQFAVWLEPFYFAALEQSLLAKCQKAQSNCVSEPNNAFDLTPDYGWCGPSLVREERPIHEQRGSSRRQQPVIKT